MVECLLGSGTNTVAERGNRYWKGDKYGSVASGPRSMLLPSRSEWCTAAWSSKQILLLNFLPIHTITLTASNKLSEMKNEWFIFWIKHPY